jgi:hypothetical protein
MKPNILLIVIYIVALTCAFAMFVGYRPSFGQTTVEMQK